MSAKFLPDLDVRSRYLLARAGMQIIKMMSYSFPALKTDIPQLGGWDDAPAP
jgi:hypothetical protein